MEHVWKIILNPKIYKINITLSCFLILENFIVIISVSAFYDRNKNTKLYLNKYFPEYFIQQVKCIFALEIINYFMEIW